MRRNKEEDRQIKKKERILRTTHDNIEDKTDEHNTTSGENGRQKKLGKRRRRVRRNYSRAT